MCVLNAYLKVIPLIPPDISERNKHLSNVCWR